MHKRTQVQPTNKPAQVVFALSQTKRRTHRLREFAESLSIANPGLLVEERDGGRVPLSRHETTSMESLLSGNVINVSCGNRRSYEDKDFGREMYLRMHLARRTQRTP